MYLIYLDESGNTGTNLSDAQQPMFVLCAMVVAEQSWIALDQDLLTSLRRHLPGASEDIEVHGVDIRTGRGPFAGIEVAIRIALRDEWMKLASLHGVRVIYRAIEKRRYAKWLLDTFGAGVLINPHVTAFPLVAQVVETFLKSRGADALGILISDENREIAPDIEKSIRTLRGIEGKLRLERIVEKGFFIESAKSRPLQLCDVIALSIRKQREEAAGHAGKAFDRSAYDLLPPLVFQGDERFVDVVDWLASQTKK